MSLKNDNIKGTPVFERVPPYFSQGFDQGPAKLIYSRNHWVYPGPQASIWVFSIADYTYQQDSVNLYPFPSTVTEDYRCPDRGWQFLIRSTPSWKLHFFPSELWSCSSHPLWLHKIQAAYSKWIQLWALTLQLVIYFLYAKIQCLSVS